VALAGSLPAKIGACVGVPDKGLPEVLGRIVSRRFCKAYASAERTRDLKRKP
jgi:hypothetical protein